MELFLNIILPAVVGTLLGTVVSQIIWHKWFVGSKAEAALDKWLTRRGWL